MIFSFPFHSHHDLMFSSGLERRDVLQPSEKLYNKHSRCITPQLVYTAAAEGLRPRGHAKIRSPWGEAAAKCRSITAPSMAVPFPI